MYQPLLLCRRSLGQVLVTVGGVVSAAEAVVNDHVLSAVIKLPAVSFTPLDPPVIVAVYVVEAASDDVGSNVVYFHHSVLLFLEYW